MMLSSLLTKPKYNRVAVISIGLSVLSIFLVYEALTLHPKSFELRSVFSNHTHEPSYDARIANGTLGFGQIYVLGLPDRTDKHDSMELAAALTGLKLTWSDGVKGDLMNPKAVPPAHLDGTKMTKDAEVGCWRGHMNILQKIVESGVESALVIEDDADWDIHIVQQLQKFAIASQEVLDQKEPRKHLEGSRPALHSPYGSEWDILWLGHLMGWPPGRDEPMAVVRGDNTVPPAFDIQDLTRNIKGPGPCTTHEGREPEGVTCDSPRLAADERIVQENGTPSSTAGYAVSQWGARKLLARLGGLSLLDVDAQFDPKMAESCRGSRNLNAGPEKLRCLIPSPAYFKPYKPKGRLASDSDIETAADPEAVREVGWSKGLVWSTRLNAGNLLDGLEPESQYVLNETSGEWRYRLPSEYRGYPGK